MGLAASEQAEHDNFQRREQSGRPLTPEEQKRFDVLRQEGVRLDRKAGANPTPIRPTIESWLKEGEGGTKRLAGNLSLEDVLKPESEGYNAFKQYALAKPGESAWEKMQLERQGLDEGTSRDAMNRQAAGSRSQAYSDLARTGGLSRGARERVGRQSSLDLTLQNQNLLRQGRGERLGIGSQAEGNRVQALGALPGAELARNQFQGNVKQFDISNILRQKALEDQGKLGQYSEEMKSWAANKQADATAASGK